MDKVNYGEEYVGSPERIPLCGIVRGKYARFLPRTKLPGHSIMVVRWLRVSVVPVQIWVPRLENLVAGRVREDRVQFSAPRLRKAEATLCRGEGPFKKLIKSIEIQWKN